VNADQPRATINAAWPSLLPGPAGGGGDDDDGPRGQWQHRLHLIGAADARHPSPWLNAVTHPELLAVASLLLTVDGGYTAR
jgi:hypothetical protein